MLILASLEDMHSLNMSMSVICTVSYNSLFSERTIMTRKILIQRRNERKSSENQ